MAEVKERGGAGEERTDVSFPFPSPYPLFHFLVLVSFLARSKPKIPFHGLFLLRNQTEALATRAAFNANCIRRWFLITQFLALKLR